MPLPVSTTSLVQELRVILSEIDRQIESIKKDVANSYPIHLKPAEDAAYRTKYTDGHFLLTDLLVAKAQCLSAIANLQSVNTQQNSRGSR